MSVIYENSYIDAGSVYNVYQNAVRSQNLIYMDMYAYDIYCRYICILYRYFCGLDPPLYTFWIFGFTGPHHPSNIDGEGAFQLI